MIGFTGRAAHALALLALLAVSRHVDVVGANEAVALVALVRRFRRFHHLPWWTTGSDVMTWPDARQQRKICAAVRTGSRGRPQQGSWREAKAARSGEEVHLAELTGGRVALQR